MAILYYDEKKLFQLNTENTTYVIGLSPEGYVGHVYYGPLLHGEPDLYPLRMDEPPFTPSVNKREKSSFLDRFPMEYPTGGVGDYRESCLNIRNAQGRMGCEIFFDSYEIFKGKRPLTGLPASFGTEDEVETLEITCKDPVLDLVVVLSYSVFTKENVITRSVRVKNEGSEALKVEKIYSACLDMDNEDFEMLSLHGSWGRERHIQQGALRYGKQLVSSGKGESSHQEHPFVALVTPGTDQERGEVYAMHFVYSGNFIGQVERCQFDTVRMVMGINQEEFCWNLKAGDEFQAPEVVMVYSAEGLGKMTRSYHAFYRRHMIRSPYNHKKRPILINNWEATYFDFDTDKLLDIAREAKKDGIEMLVMDDGWFGHRDNDTSSLGDWQENRSKLPGGVKQLADKINALGLDFGIWVEPEMVNEDSDLYRTHPEWAVRVPGQSHAEGRHQMLLDLTNKDVRDHIVEAMANVFSSANISYVKWDMNRIMSDRYSQTLPSDRQGEFGHRYVLGLYDIMGRITKRFPEILFEGCAAGGNRFDLGILCYMPQIWASDDTDARERLEIQTGYSYGYPMSVVSSHVSGCPNHQTLRVTPLETRFGVAAFGVLGYECNLCDMKKKDLDAIKDQVEFYKKHRHTLQFGEYHRIENGSVSDLRRNVYQFMVVSQDGSEAVSCYYEGQVIPNYTYKHMRTKGLDENAVYVMEGRSLQYSVKLMGDLINTVTPVHVKPDSLTQSAIDKVVKLQGEKEYVKASGAVFNRVGVNLAPNFAGTGYNDQTALWTEHGLRLYTFTRQ